jgi:hypothetical protein
VSTTPTWILALNGGVFVLVILFAFRRMLRVLRAPGVTRSAYVYAIYEFTAGGAWFGIMLAAVLASQHGLISPYTAIAIFVGTFLVAAVIGALLRRYYPDDDKPTQRL